jgi:hypothetical protein
LLTKVTGCAADERKDFVWPSLSPAKSDLGVQQVYRNELEANFGTASLSDRGTAKPDGKLSPLLLYEPRTTQPMTNTILPALLPTPASVPLDRVWFG